MKALIIDDEKHVRDAIRLLVDWGRYGITSIHEAKDGQEGIALIQEHQPELIFTDMMMPNTDGAAVMEWSAKHAPASKLIVISGHDDFRLVRNAVTFGSIDYILKPIEPAQLNEAILRATEELRKEEQERSRSRSLAMELNRLKPMYVEQYFCSVLNEPGTPAAMPAELQRELGLDEPLRRLRAALVSLELSSPAVREKFAASGPDLMFFALTNIVNEVLSSRASGYAFRNWGKEQELVLVLWGEGESAPGPILEAVNAALRDTLRTRFVFGLSEAASFPQGAGGAYEQAKLALLRRNVLGPSSDYVLYEEAAVKRGAPLLSFHEYEEQIRFAVQGGSKDHIQRALGAWFEHIEKSGFISFEQLTLWQGHFELTKTLWEQRDGDGGDGGDAGNVAPAGEELTQQPLRIPVTAEGRFDYPAWKEAVYQQVKVVSDRILSKDKERGIIREIAKFLEQRAHEDITLQDVANHFYLSREYISRKFKQEMNENVSDYIAGIRMNRAKELLGNRALKISQVAEQVGFQDEKYFSKVFKKWTGCTPNDYRKGHYGE
ncbi:response regulator [Paenibacillus sp. PL2-23]|uniref:response regulator n=1 Tax=Paenibacillus sp. PL2-23 TaxID=2100729 RepID=UPI0030F5CBE4